MNHSLSTQLVELMQILNVYQASENCLRLNVYRINRKEQISML